MRQQAAKIKANLSTSRIREKKNNEKKSNQIHLSRAYQNLGNDNC